ncbi:TolC family protein [Pseudoalteromonas xiamenensis]|uniref:TolC family protein n=1 Tax=Pseudoalteromonas xiamenensis TaxID=882626 RepID=UPI0035EB49C8
MKYSLTHRTIKKPIGYRFFVALLGLFISSSSIALENQQTITLADAITLTLKHHPDLKTYVSKEKVLDGRIQQAGIGERMQIGLMAEDALGTGDHSALKSLQTTLTFSWLLQQEQLDGRVKAVHSEAQQLALEKQVKALDLSALVAKLFVDVLVKQERLKLNLLAKSQAHEVVAAITKRTAAGKSSNIELQLAKAELVRRELAVEDIEHELKASQYKLAALWGKPSVQYRFAGRLENMPTVPEVDAQLALLLQNPRLQLFTSSQRIAESRIELARIEAKPQWQVSAGVRRYEATDDFGFVAGITIPWGQGNTNAGHIAALKAEQDMLSQEQESLMQQLNTQLYVLLQEMAHSQHVIQTTQQQIVPLLDDALSEAHSAFDKGQLGYTQYSNVRNELLAAQTQLLDAVAGIHLKHIEIQRLTGSSISQ